MRLPEIICIILLSGTPGYADDLIFFADDHYKALGAPLLNASAADPVLTPGGESVLQINLANSGRVEELMPIRGNGSEADAALEMKEEMRSADAQNLTATILGSGPLRVTSGPQHIDYLPSGAVALMQFNISAGSDASGWYDLPLRLDYDHQVDASVSEGVISPLYQPGNATQSIRAFVPGGFGPLRPLGSRLDLAPGGRGTLLVVIKNNGPQIWHNCSAHLLAAPPLYDEGEDSPLGDMNPGALAVASFSLRADRDATAQDYQMGCEVVSEEGQEVISFPVTLSRTENRTWALLAFGSLTLIAAAAAALLLLERRGWLRRRRWGRGGRR
jgi:hypothetical protein